MIPKLKFYNMLCNKKVSILFVTFTFYLQIWSPTSEKWIHVDPCDNIINKPLIYEKGWNKQLSYIIAYSKDEVQDVTWRYTQNQEAVMNRRTICSEQSLMKVISLLNTERQISFSKVRVEYINKRRLLELANMIYIPNSQDNDSNESYEGRTSGSLAWRLARGEVMEVRICSKLILRKSSTKLIFKV